MFYIITLIIVTEYDPATCQYKSLIHIKKGKACVAICGLLFPTGDDRRPNDTSYQVQIIKI